MGTSYNICCMDCKVYYWIGQSGAGSVGPWLYCDKEEVSNKCQPKITNFLNEHEGHNLKYLGDYSMDFIYEETDESGEMIWKDYEDIELETLCAGCHLAEKHEKVED